MLKFTLALLFLSLQPVHAQLNCNNWLFTPSAPSSVKVGNIAVSGNQLTIEANYTRTAYVTQYLIASIDLVCNNSIGNFGSPCYHLATDLATVTTTNGLFSLLAPCPSKLNKIYHTALVYDGSTLKFYRNGFLINQTNASGNLIVNNNNTTSVGLNEFTNWAADLSNFIGYINEVRIWNVARSQSELRTYMNSSLPNPTSQTGLLAYYTFDNLLNKQGNAAYNGTLYGSASINKTNPNCTYVADSCGFTVCTPPYDFSYQQDVCNPLSVQFFAAGAPPVNTYWNFGDGNIASGTVNPTHVYTTPGTYTVKFRMDNASCSDTVYKTINIQPAIADVVITPDTTICAGSTKLLRAQPSANFCWSPTTYLNNPALNNPTTSTPTNITYYYTAEMLGNNLITNGDFSAGNTGFTTAYNYAPNNTVEGEYFIGPNPVAWNGGAAACVDHTSGNGNMMLVNGAPVANTVVWKQTVAVTPNTNYNFACWVQSIYFANPARLQFSINNILVGNIFSPGGTTCNWQRFFSNWNSGNNSTAVISIVNLNTIAGGNDFALDDISFATTSIKRDSVKITVETPAVNATGNATVCSGVSTLLNANGAASYSWLPITGLSNPNIANPIATPLNTTTYTVTGTTVNGCSAQASVQVTVLPASNFDFSYKQSVCNPLSVQFFGAGTTPVNPYWSFGDGNTALGNANPTHVFAAYGNYNIKYHIDNATCPDTVTKVISLKSTNADIVITPDTTICAGSTKLLRAQPSDNFCWSPTTYLNNPALNNPTTSTPNNITYYYTAEVLGNNLITNGDFSAGNNGFTTAYNYAPNNTVEGEYFVGPNPIAWNPGAAACVDHTGGNGNMMLVNGAPVANTIVWKQTVPVTANTNYNFACWVQSIYFANPAQLQFSINNILVGSTFSPGGTTCNWQRFFSNWNSGNNSTAVISIVNLNTIAGGNDFALDDISFATTSIKRDSVKITVSTPVVNALGNATICSGTSTQLNANGAATYSWSPATGLSNANIANPIATPATTTTYTVTGTTTSGCSAQASVQVTVLPASNFDFSYSQSVCNPLSVQFFSAGTTPVNPYWSFGDGNSASGNVNPTHVYPANGIYTVKYHIDNSTCPDTVTKVISLQSSNADIVITPDTTICFGATKQLRSQPALSFCWSPATYLNNPLLPNPVTSTTVPITYYFTAEIPGGNLISNGNFSAGNTGFTSGYNYAASNTTEGEYFVGTNPKAWNGLLSACTDHTSGNGNMLLVNGSPVANVVAWNQTVNVTPNTNYAFSTWIQALYTPNPAQLSFSINGISIGNLITASLPTCNWTQFYTTWNSGNNSSASISIINKNTIVQGNDFALDDISFSPVLIKRDSVKISVETPVVNAIGATSVCSGIPTQLNANGAATYSWSPATGLSNPNIANPTATPPATTTYTVTGTTVNGCSAQSSATVTVLPKPVITKIPDTAICKNASVQLFAGGGTSYVWTPAATLNNPNIANPVATPTATVTKYYVTVTNSNVNLCSNKDSVTVTIKPAPLFTVSPPASTCQGTAAQLNASGGDIYLWSPASLVTNPSVSNPFTTALSSASYSVTITESSCNISTTLFTSITVNPVPQVSAKKSNDINCSIGFANLLASGAVQYTWTPSTGLSNTTIANPIATPNITTQYIVNGVNNFGCTGADTLTVVVSTTGKSGYLMPNSFTPNGDGKNDCFGIKFWGIVQELQFFIYNRYGERVFYTTDPNNCWDGKYKTDKPEPGNYVFYIKAKTACGAIERKGNVVLIR